MNISAAGLALLVLCLNALPLHAAEGDRAVDLKSVEIVRIAESEAPVIDGTPDEAAWSKAALVEDFHEYQPNNREVANQRSRFYVMYDKDAIYVAARLDGDPALVTNKILRQGQRLSAEDKIIVILDTFNDKRNGYRFEVNPNGIRDDALYLESTQTQYNWDGIYQARARITAEGWTAEMAIPFKTLSFDASSTTWGINFGRFLARTNEWNAWVSQNRTQNPGTSGVVTGLSGMDQGLGLDLVPSLSFRQRKDFVTGEDEFKMEPSIDAYYRITPGLNASVTFNTDFSATEVDDRQVELDRFSLFFPEKRAFFLRESDIFEFGRIKNADTNAPVFGRASQENGKPFFSRSIGLGATGEPVDIIAGAKLAGRIAGLNVGALAIRQDEYLGVDAQSLFVGRAVANVLDQSSIGFIATSGNPRSNLDNTLVGGDFRYLSNRFLGNKTLEGEVWLQQSDTEGLDGDDRAWGARVRSPNSTGLRGGLGLKTLETNFNPALGFVNRRGIYNYTSEIGYTKRFPVGLVQSVYAGIDAQEFDRIGGSMESRAVTVRLLEWATRVNDQFKIRLHSSDEVLDEPYEIFDGVVLPEQRYSFDEYEFDFDSASFRPLSWILNWRAGDFYSGERWRATGELVWKASPRFWLTGNYQYNDVELPEGNFIVRVIAARFDVMFSSTLSWATLFQYDTDSDNVGGQSRLVWIPQAGQEFFFVYNHDLLDELNDSEYRSQQADATLKLSYTFRF